MMMGCAAPKEEQKSTTFDCDHPQAIRITEETHTPTVEYIQINPDNTTYSLVWAGDNLTNGKLTVEVPLKNRVFLKKAKISIDFCLELL